MPKMEKHEAIAAMLSERQQQPEPLTENGVGLSVDMTDVARLRQWSGLIRTYGPNISAWGSSGFVSEECIRIADRLDEAIRDIGELRRTRTEVLEILSAEKRKHSLESTRQAIEAIQVRVRALAGTRGGRA